MEITTSQFIYTLFTSYFSHVIGSFYFTLVKLSILLFWISYVINRFPLNRNSLLYIIDIVDSFDCKSVEFSIVLF